MRKHCKVQITCNQCGHTWIELDGIPQAIQCLVCKHWDVTIEVI